MMEVDIAVDSQAVSEKLGWLAAAAGVTVRDVCADQMRLYCADMMKMTPPTGGSYPKQRRAGEGAVLTDMNGLFSGMDAGTTAKPGTMGGREMVHIQPAEGNGYWIPVDNYHPNPSTGELRKFHESQRNSRGRVRGAKGRATINKWHIPAGAKALYVNLIFSHLGRAKAGWLAGLRHYAQLSRGAMNPPDWVTRHGQAEGEVFGNMDADGNGEMGAVSRVPYADHTEGRRIRAAQRTRQRDLDKWAEKRIDQLTKRFKLAEAA